MNKKRKITSEQIVFACLSTFLLLPNIMGIFMAKDLLTLGQHILYAIGAFCLYAWGLTIFKKRTFFYVASLGFLFNAIEIVHLIIYQATTSLLFIFTCIKSEKGEFFELLSVYWFIILIFFALWGVYYYLNHRYIRQEWIASPTIRGLAFGVFATFFALSGVMLNTKTKFRNIFNTQAQDMRTAAWVGVEKVNPINMMLSFYHLGKLNWQITQHENQIRDFVFGIPKQNDPTEPVLVFLIGETSRYDHWQLNGYTRPTSPRLMARAEQIISFDSCYAVANLTTVSVPFMLSRATPNNQMLYLNEKSAVDAFHEAGYKTAWIADQSFNNHFLLRIANGCDDEFYITDEGDGIFTDTVLIPSFQQVLKKGGKQMIVLHSLGCHFKYSQRYTEDFQIFTPDMNGLEILELMNNVDENAEGKASGSSALIRNLRTILINSYDNAICYTDYFMDQIIAELQATQRPAVLVYIGDHGENLLDDERNMFLHGSFSGSQYEYHVPLFVWTSSQYQALHPDKVEAMKHNRTKKMSNMNIFHSLLDLQSLPYDSLDYTHSFASPLMEADSIIIGLDANLKPVELPIMTPKQMSVLVP